MKKVILVLVMLLSMLLNSSYACAYSYGAVEGLPNLSQFSQDFYVIYKNGDTANTELAVVHADDISDRSIMIDRKEQIAPPESFYVFEDDSFAPFDNLKLSVLKTDMPVYVSKWILDENDWVLSETTVDELICSNTGELLYSNMPIIEVLRKTVPTAVRKRNYDGKYYVDSTTDYSTFPGKAVLLLSDDGINFDQRILLPNDGNYNYPISKTVRGNGIVIALGSTEFTNLPEYKRWKGYTNFRMYILNENYEYSNTVNLNTLRECAGFHDGNFYFYDKAYDIDRDDPKYNDEHPYHKHFYKSNNGIDLIEISEDEYQEAERIIKKLQKLTEQGYFAYSEAIKENGKDVLISYMEVDGKTNNIVFEKNDVGISTYPINGNKWVNLIRCNTGEKQKKAITFDGIYKSIPVPADTSRLSSSIWSTEHNVYVDVDKEKYYRIPIDPSCLNNTIVQLHDKILGFETPPVMENDRTLVPMRFLFEQLGADVQWEEATQTATATLANKAVAFSIDENDASVNSQTVTMDVPARLINDKTMVPLRFLSENLGYTVTWDEATNTAIIE